ncbi:MAG: histidinol-phosphatase HisJ family protein [Lachnospiraceae bacterium]|nr:histidinol-phosphatase HisJ family protein [Lachnospiraceae bacterium]
MLSDFHIHTGFSGDSQTPPRDQAEAALRLNMSEICITDHHDYGTKEMSPIDFTLNFSSYLPAMRALQAEYAGKLRINIGVEIGLMLREKEYLTALEKELDVDYLIGSSHFIDGIDVYDRAFYSGRSEAAAYRRYFESTLERVRLMDCFDSLGHLDFPIRYSPTKNQNYRPEDYMDVIDEILRLLIARGKALECNTAGFKYGLGQPNPHEAILRRYRELGGELLTVGSDAHKASELGGDFTQAAALLIRCGFPYYTVYHARRPEFVNLE